MPRKCSASRTIARVVHAAFDDGVHLDGQPGRGGGVDSLEHPLDRKLDVVEGAEGRVVDGVEADGDAGQAGPGERFGLLREQSAVRRQCELELGDLREQLDELLDVTAHERLAAGDAHGADAEPGEDAGHARDLLEAEQLAPLEKRVVAAEDVLRHAVDAAEVAAVRDRHPKRLERPAEPVEQGLHG